MPILSFLCSFTCLFYLQEDFYELLGCNLTDDFPTLKAALRNKQLQCHPDKCQLLSAGEQDNRKSQFHALERAWRVLENLASRQRYNAILTQTRLQEKSVGRPIQGEVDWHDFEPAADVDSPESVDPEEVFSHPCRCGGEYLLEGVAVIGRMSYAYCCQCSLVVKVIYPTNIKCAY